MAPSLIFDFDGTLALGNGPVRAYARAIEPHARPGFMRRIDDHLAALSSDNSPCRDGYHAVALEAQRDGVDQQTMNAAYTASREQLGTPDAPVELPEGLADWLGEQSRKARISLATNAPSTGIDALLERWGIRQFFTELNFELGKPEGMRRVVATYLADGPVLSIGDIADYDLVPARDLGAATALVGPWHDHSDFAADFHGATVMDIAGSLTAWIDSF